MNKTSTTPNVEDTPFVTVATANGTLRVKVTVVNGQLLLIATSLLIPDVPVVRFQSSCVFGEAFHAIDCDCGVQLASALQLICREGGILIYAWEEGRGAGIIDKVRAMALQQTYGMSTARAFEELGHQADPRTFEAHIAALQQVHRGSRIKLASRNPKKIAAVERAGYIVERIKLPVTMTREQEAYIAHKRDHLGHLNDD